MTSGSIGSEEDFNMANGDASSSDSAPSVTNRPALQQFRKQKEQAAVEGMDHVIMIKEHLRVCSCNVIKFSNPKLKSHVRFYPHQE